MSKCQLFGTSFLPLPAKLVLMTLMLRQSPFLSRMALNWRCRIFNSRRREPVRRRLCYRASCWLLANRSLQVFLRRSLRMVMITVCRAMAVPGGQEAAVPDFHAMSSLSEVRGSSMFGPQGPGYVPGFGRVSV